MGCVKSKEGKEESAGVERNVPKPLKMKISTARGKEQQGVHELKQNYVINKDTKVLGAG